jgi:nucleoside-diphosphate-sugar epimerase
MRVFITGASGFIGRALDVRLRDRGDEVCGVDFTADPDRGIVAGDVSKPGSWQQALGGCDLVLHTAAIVSNAVTLDAAWRVNTVGTRNVIDAAMAAKVKRFVYVSSIRAFGDLGLPDDVTEDYPVKPDGNPYVDTRIATEQVVLAAHGARQISATIVRPGDVYGPGSRPWTLIPLDLISKNRFVLPAMGKGIFSPVYIDDLVDGILLAAQSPKAVGQIFTLSGGVGVTCKEFFAHHYEWLGKRGPAVVPTAVALALAEGVSGAAKALRIETETNPTAVRYFTRTGTYSIEKARRLLGYEPQVDLAEGMARTKAWAAAQGLIKAV